jgi:hypothetical protein
VASDVVGRGVSHILHNYFRLLRSFYDIEAIQTLRDQLIGADGTLEQKKFARKAKTVN